MEVMSCGNEHCIKSREHRGGRYRYHTGDKKFYCVDCFAVRAVFNDGKNLWDFETTHFTGDRVHVRSRSHLDQLCRQHGVSNHAREHMERNW